MLRKILLFAITSGLAGKMWRAYRQRHGVPMQGTQAARYKTR